MRHNNLFRLDRCLTVVVGGAGVIGRELARGLAESGAVVVIADIDDRKGKAVAERLDASGLKVLFRHLDIRDENSIAALINYLDKKYGRIDVWINSAYPRTSDWGAKFERAKFESIKKNVDMHLNGYILCCKKAAEYMKTKKTGSVINIASIYGIVGPDFSIYEGTPMTMPAAYSAIKGGIIAFTRFMASYYGKDNVRVNCISPGGVYDGHKKVFVKRYAKKTALGRMATAKDMIGAAIYLASDASEYVTGHNLVVDGGWSII